VPTASAGEFLPVPVDCLLEFFTGSHCSYDPPFFFEEMMYQAMTKPILANETEKGQDGTNPI
jgi:hypothetical protein